MPLTFNIKKAGKPVYSKQLNPRWSVRALGVLIGFVFGGAVVVPPALLVLAVYITFHFIHKHW